MYISINTINDLAFSSYDLQCAENIYLDDSIRTLSAIKEDDHSVVVKAQFPSDYFFQKHNINSMLRIDMQTKQAKYHCSCSNNFDGKYLCKHCLSLLFFINEINFDLLPFEYAPHRNTLSRKRASFYEHLNDLSCRELAVKRTAALLENHEADIYQPEEINNTVPQHIYINMNYGILSFKVGNKKSYQIKSLTSFLESIDQDRVVNYGKSLAFKHNEQAFDEKSLKAIKLIRHLLTLESADFRGGKIEVDYHNISVIYNCLSNYPASLTNINLSEENEPINLEVVKEDKEYVIKNDIYDEKILGSDGFYRIESNDKISTIHRYCVFNKDIYNMLNTLRFEHLILAEEQIKPFYYRYVKPLFGKINFVNYPYIEDINETRTILKGIINDEGIIEFVLNCEYDDNSTKNPLVDKGNYSNQVNKIINTLQQYGTKNIDKFSLNSDDNKTKDFMQNILPLINRDVEVYLSDALLNYGKKQKYKLTVGLTYHNDLLHVNVSSIDIPADELSNVLRAYQKKQKFYRLKDGDTISLYSDELQQLNDLMNTYGITAKDLKKDDITLNPYRAMALAEEKEKNLTIERTTQFDKYLKNFAKVKDDDFHISEKYNDILRDYQKFGVEWMHHLKKLNFGGILADDMGLGKTLEVISLLESEKAQLSIVICPASLIFNWNDEIKKFNSSLRTLPIYGNKEHRDKLIQQATDYDLLITSYDYLRNDIAQYEKITFDTVILDEAQYIKNQKTKNAESVKMLKSKHRFALTGTPIENSLAELWSIFDFLMPGYLFTYNYFKTNFENNIINQDDENTKNRLKNMIAPFILRRNKKDVLTELPDKEEHTITIDFSEEERKIYLANLIQVNKQLQQELKSENFDKIAILAMITKLRQICADSRLVYSNITNVSSKISGCLELIQTLKENNKKVLLFSGFTSALDLIEEELNKNNISYHKLTGATKKKDRHSMVESFQRGDVDVFLISLKAGGTGLNLTKAEAVIHFDPWWNISAQNQATDRAYRIGQHNNVQIYKMIIKDSIEERMLLLQEKKKELSDTFIEGNEGKVMKMDKKDFEELLSYK
ncbi:MAG: SNF2-related protein [Erysipelotrichia bacterium]|nr:SNF2-related protein [Erysipelotrichia bacterium]